MSGSLGRNVSAVKVRRSTDIQREPRRTAGPSSRSRDKRLGGWSGTEDFADADRGLARGDLYVDSGDLRQLIGHSTTSLAEAVAAALR
jgi:hypothetical protein